MPFRSVFINEKNKLNHKNAVLTCLEADFNAQGKPTNHFWGNANTIRECFDECRAMVTLNQQKKVVGYMIWHTYECGAEIDIAEVWPKYRKKGILKNMLQAFSDQFTDLHVLSGDVLPQSKAVFTHLGWTQQVVNSNTSSYPYFPFIKIIRPITEQVSILPNGRVLAFCSKTDITAEDPKENQDADFYRVSDNPQNYRMKYFQIDLDEKGKLRLPIVTSFHYDGYIGVYFNKELLSEGKAKHLFTDGLALCHSTFLAINNFDPIDPQLFISKGFLPQAQTTITEETESTAHKTKKPKTEASSSTPSQTSFTSNTSTLFHPSTTSGSSSTTTTTPENTNQQSNQILSKK